MIGMNFLAYKSPILLSYIDLQRKKISTTMFFVERHLDVVLEDPLWLERKVSLAKLVDNQLRSMPTKFHDDRTINS